MCGYQGIKRHDVTLSYLLRQTTPMASMSKPITSASTTIITMETPEKTKSIKLRYRKLEKHVHIFSKNIKLLAQSSICD